MVVVRIEWMERAGLAKGWGSCVCGESGSGCVAAKEKERPSSARMSWPTSSWARRRELISAPMMWFSTLAG